MKIGPGKHPWPFMVQKPRVMDRPRMHRLYDDNDVDRPDVICDSNGQVVLSLCKVCGQAEGELQPNCPGAKS